MHLSLQDFRSVALLAIAIAVGTLACSDGGGAGASCKSNSDCASDFQCANEICIPRCAFNRECGDGYNCTESGLCESVASAIGDACASEWECGIGQSCQLDRQNPNHDSILTGFCQQQGVGGDVGAVCGTDAECRSNLCTLGHCSELCSINSDCPFGTHCDQIPILLADSTPLFYGCLQSTGVLSTEITMESPSERLRIPVPKSARSVALVASVKDESHLVGATRVVSPRGALLFNGSGTPEELVANPIRFLRSKGVSTLFFPNSDGLDLETGIYQIDVEASLPPFGPGTEIPKVNVFYKLDTSRILDLHFYFLDLDEHPCRDSFDVDTLDASTAAISQNFQIDFLGELKSILTSAGIKTGIVSYSDLDRADLDGLSQQDVPTLLSLADNKTGIAIFVVRSLSPDGVQALAGGTPGPPRSPGTSASGIVISADTLCYRPWESLARVTAHTIGTQMGLWDNRAPDGIEDPISDTDSSTDNLMFFGEFGGTSLSEGQIDVLSRYPGLR